MDLCASLSEAVWQCDTVKVQQLLDQGADRNEAHNDETPLLPAARLGSAGCVGALLKAGADPGWTRRDGATALHTACSGSPLPYAAPANHEDCIQLLLEAGAEVDALTLRGLTPLHEAVLYQHPAIALTLLAAGADPNIADSAGETPLHTACRLGDFDMAWLLLRGGASATAASSTGDTPMHRASGLWPPASASRSGHKALLQLLLEAGADVNARGCDGRTPLFRAGMADLEILLAAGADVHVRDSSGQTVLHDLGWGREAAPRLLAAGADANARDASGETPLHKVACMKSPEEGHWRVLLDAGADPNAANEAGVTPLLYCDPWRSGGCCHGSVQNDKGQCQMAAALLDAGADVNAATTQPFAHPGRTDDEHPVGTTFLHIHAGCGFNDVSRCVQLALQAGADVWAVDGNGRTPLDLAATSNLQAMLAAQQEEPQQGQQPAAHASPPPLSYKHFPPLNAPPRPGVPASADAGPAPPEHVPLATAVAGGATALPATSQHCGTSISGLKSASIGQQHVQQGGDLPCGVEPGDGAPATIHEAPEGQQQQQQSVRQGEEQGGSNVLGSSEAVQPAAAGVAVLASREDVAALPVRVLTAMLRTLGVDHRGCTEKRELVELLAGRAACPLRQGGQQAQHGQQAEGPGSPGAAGCGREGGGSDSSERGVSVGGPCGAQGQSESQEQEGQSKSQEQQGSDTATAPHPARHCACCGVASGPGVRLKLCSGCYSVRYCCGVCQLQAWPQHKAACRAFQHNG